MPFKRSMKNMIYHIEVDFVDFEKWMKCYGAATVGERGQVSLPAELREKLKIKPGEKLLVLGAEAPGFQHIMLVKSDAVAKMIEKLSELGKFVSEEGARSLEESLLGNAGALKKKKRQR